MELRQLRRLPEVLQASCSDRRVCAFTGGCVRSLALTASMASQVHFGRWARQRNKVRKGSVGIFGLNGPMDVCGFGV